MCENWLWGACTLYVVSVGQTWCSADWGEWRPRACYHIMPSTLPRRHRTVRGLLSVNITVENISAKLLRTSSQKSFDFTVCSLICKYSSSPSIFGKRILSLSQGHSVGAKCKYCGWFDVKVTVSCAQSNVSQFRNQDAEHFISQN